MDIIKNIAFILSLIFTLWFGFLIFARLIRGQEISGIAVFIWAINLTCVIMRFFGMY